MSPESTTRIKVLSSVDKENSKNIEIRDHHGNLFTVFYPQETLRNLPTIFVTKKFSDANIDNYLYKLCKTVHAENGDRIYRKLFLEKDISIDFALQKDENGKYSPVICKLAGKDSAQFNQPQSGSSIPELISIISSVIQNAGIEEHSSPTITTNKTNSILAAFREGIKKVLN